jgi:hypothetical protein
LPAPRADTQYRQSEVKGVKRYCRGGNGTTGALPFFDFPTSRPSLVVILRKQWGLSPAKKVTGFGASWA